MRSKTQKWKTYTLLGVMLFLSDITFAEGGTNVVPDSKADSLLSVRSFMHKIGLEIRPGFILPTSSFLKGDNNEGKPIENTFSTHLKYIIQSSPGTCIDRVYSGSYQGVGLAYYTFFEREQLGNPMALYLFQGGRIARLTSRLSANYEWNFGLSFGWNPYDYYNNGSNRIIGSKANAYLNVNFYLNWTLSNKWDFISGATLSHFSNGNTKFPNAGLNTTALKVGLVYNISGDNNLAPKSMYRAPVPKFLRYVSYDMVLFGSWRRKGVVSGEDQIASPHAYPVLGFNFAPMYNMGYKFRVGVSLDGVYDGSANVYTEDYIVGTDPPFLKPPVNKQLALGISGRAEYVMPYFTVGLGLGKNVLHGGGDLKGFYQVLALKIEITRSSFIHIGYNLKDFHDPNFLMLGIGYRFNNKYPFLHR